MYPALVRHAPHALILTLYPLEVELALGASSSGVSRWVCDGGQALGCAGGQASGRTEIARLSSLRLLLHESAQPCVRRICRVHGSSALSELVCYLVARDKDV